MNHEELITWILSGDPAIVYKARTELLMEPVGDLEDLHRSLITQDGYVKRYLYLRDPETGMWGGGIYTPKWTSTHYTLLELKNMNCPGNHEPYRQSAVLLADSMWHRDGFIRRGRYVDLCVAAMMGSIMCHGGLEDHRIGEIMDYMLAHIQKDGGFNCSWQRSEKSSIHTTLTVLQFFLDYENCGYAYRLEEARAAALPAEEWLLDHELYKKKSTGEPVHKIVVNLPYPSRYKYDFLKGLEYFVDRDRGYDPRMKSAIELLKSKRLKSGAWPSTGNHGREEYFKIRDEGKDHRMNTLRALRVLGKFE